MKKIITLLILSSGTFWIFLNIFYIPFYPWTEGLYRPYLIVNGLIPYKDFAWIRTPLDIYLLAGIYKIFGIHELGYQILIFSLQLSTSFLIFFGLLRKRFSLACFAYLSYVILLPPLFMNTEIDETLASFFIILTFFILWTYKKRRSSLVLLLSGITSSLTVLTKQTSTAVIIAILVYLIFVHKSNIKSLAFYFAGLLIPASILAIFLIIHNAMFDFIYYAFYFNLFIYRQWAQSWGIKDAMLMLGLYFSILTPFVFLKTKSIFDDKVKVLLLLITFSLIPSLLPSFWSYRLITAFPLFCIAIAVFVSKGYQALREKPAIPKIIIGGSSLIFLLFFQYFLGAYIGFINSNGFSYGQYIYDYGDDERNVAVWLRDNTDKKEKIFNMANNIIMLKSNHLPHNKYVDQIPIAYYPLDKSYKEITSKPPKIVVFDRSALDNFLVNKDWARISKDWKFIDFLDKNYRVAKRIGTIYVYFIKTDDE